MQYKGDLASAADEVKLSKLRREASLIDWEILGETLDADHRMHLDTFIYGLKNQTSQP